MDAGYLMLMEMMISGGSLWLGAFQEYERTRYNRERDIEMISLT